MGSRALWRNVRLINPSEIAKSSVTLPHLYTARARITSRQTAKSRPRIYYRGSTTACCVKLAQSELNCSLKMKAVLALAMGAAALAPSQPKVRKQARALEISVMTSKTKS